MLNGLIAALFCLIVGGVSGFLFKKVKADKQTAKVKAGVDAYLKNKGVGADVRGQVGQLIGG